MGLASLVTTVIGFAVASQSGKTYAARWQGAVEVGRRMANAIVEYVGGIQVVKAFSQSAGSYKRYSDAVTENAQYYVDWMADNQKYMAVMQSVIPSVLLPVLPVGLIFWSGGSLSTAVFLTIVVLSLGFTGPLVSAMTFVDELAVVGTNVGEISAILDAPELERPMAETKLNGLGIRLDRALRGEMLAALTIDRPLLYRMAGASRLTLYPSGRGAKAHPFGLPAQSRCRGGGRPADASGKAYPAPARRRGAGGAGLSGGQRPLHAGPVCAGRAPDPGCSGLEPCRFCPDPGELSGPIRGAVAPRRRGVAAGGRRLSAGGPA